VDVTDKKALEPGAQQPAQGLRGQPQQDPEALQDWVKWNAQRQDDLSKATSAALAAERHVGPAWRHRDEVPAGG
jgi:hypothetical protein